MWLCLNNAFVSIVDKDCGPDELMVRARREGDIQKLFPNAKVTRYTKSDYLYRAPVKRTDIAAKLLDIVMDIGYDNFKDSVKDKRLKEAYGNIWWVMSQLQSPPPYSGA